MSDINEWRLTTVEKAVGDISESLRRLVQLEERHTETREALSRAFTNLGDHEDRLRGIEVEMPTVKLTRRWVIGGVVGVWMLLVTVAGGVAIRYISGLA